MLKLHFRQHRSTSFQPEKGDTQTSSQPDTHTHTHKPPEDLTSLHVS
jgi:hypothetical protein